MTGEKSVFDLPDDEVMGMTEAPAAVENVAIDTGTDTTSTSTEEVAEVTEATGTGAEGDEADDKVTETKSEGEEVEETAADKVTETKSEGEEVEETAADKVTDDKKVVEPTLPVDLASYTPEHKAAAFDEIMKPFKANGREIKLESPGEAVKLMQMGANYTKKMQALQPSMKVLQMLRNNELLDEGKLGFLIDLHKKNPEAIQKLVMDAGIQPMDIDADKANSYTPGDHRVSDGEIALQAVMEEVATSDTGLETIEIVTRQWDADSRQAVFHEPALLAVIDSQRKNGIYDRISSEIERQRTLGNLRGVPFIKAYKIVGDDLQEKGLLAPKREPQPAPVPLAVKTVVPEKKVMNTEKARAAATTRVTTASPAKEVDPLELSDEAFLKQMENRL